MSVFVTRCGCVVCGPYGHWLVCMVGLRSRAAPDVFHPSQAVCLVSSACLTAQASLQPPCTGCSLPKRGCVACVNIPTLFAAVLAANAPLAAGGAHSWLYSWVASLG